MSSLQSKDNLTSELVSIKFQKMTDIVIGHAGSISETINKNIDNLAIFNFMIASRNIKLATEYVNMYPIGYINYDLAISLYENAKLKYEIALKEALNIYS